MAVEEAWPMEARAAVVSARVWAWAFGLGLEFGLMGFSPSAWIWAWFLKLGLELKLGLVEFVAVASDKKSKTNLLPRLLAPEEAEEGVGSNLKGKELAFF